MVELGTECISLILVQAHATFRRHRLGNNKISTAIQINYAWVI